MDKRALALDKDKILVPVLEHQLLGRAGYEIADHRIDRDTAAADHDAGLAGREKFRRMPSLSQGRHQLQGRQHLSDTAVVPDRMHPEAGCVARLIR